MSQPNIPGSPEDSSSDDAREEQPAYRQAAEEDDRRDPYLNEGRAEQDLDARAPQLGRHESKKVNRMAWGLVAGCCVLMAGLVIAALWNRRNASSSEKVEPQEERVVVPDTPENPLTDAQPAAPIALYSPADARRNSPSEQESASEAPSAPRGPTLIERRMASAEVALGSNPSQDPYAQAMLEGLPNGKPSEKPQENPQVKTTRAQFLSNPDALLVRGTYLRCVLETRIITDIKGFTSCIVTESVYSINGRKLLIPKGSKISGAYDTDANGPRVSVVWDRIITPTGVDVTMSSPGVDNLGGAGHPGDYNAHWASRMSSALMISLISDAFKYTAAEHGPPSTTVTNGIVTQEPFESNTARTMERLANQALERSVSRPATVTINQGEVVNVYVAQDIDFSGVAAGI